MFDNPTTKCIKNRATRISRAKAVSTNQFMYDNKKFVLGNVYGEHNIDNATVAVQVCKYFGVS